MRPRLLHARDVAGMNAARFVGAKTDIDRDAFGAQPLVALAGDFRIGIFQRRHHARDAGLDDGVGAGRRLALMRARLERHVHRGALRGFLGVPQRLDLGMRAAAGLRPAAAKDDAVLHDHRADRRIGPGRAQPAPAERQRQRHEARVVRFGRGLNGRCLVAHLRAAAAVSSSPDNSSSAARKSLASRKLR